MKLTINFKDPDAVSDAISDAVKKTRPQGLSDDEWDDIREERESDVGDSLKRWIEYGEYLSVEIDTDAKTATVVNQN